MKKYSFREWIERRRLNEASLARGIATTYDAVADPKEGDVVISNPIQFFKTILRTPKKGAYMKDVTVSPQDFSSWTIKGIEDDQITAERMVFGSYSSRIKDKPTRLFNLYRLKPVTEAFNNSPFVSKGVNYFIDLGKSARVEELYRQYLNATRASATGGSEEDLKDLKVRSILGGDTENKLVKDRLNQGANQIRQSQQMQMANRAKSGEDITNYVKDEIDDPHFATSYRRAGAGAVVDQLRLKGYRIAGEPALSPQELQSLQDVKQMQGLVTHGAAEHLLSNPIVQQKLENDPRITYYASLLGYKELLQTLQGQSGGDLMSRIQQQRQQQPQQSGQAALDAMFNASHNPGLRFARHWKYFTESAVGSYRYYPE